MTNPPGPVPIERLLEHHAWVRSLARALVLDESRADDVAQDAWLAAMRAPPRHDGSLRAWLGRLVRHRAADLRRGERRREARDRTAPPERSNPEPAEALGRIEEQARVARAVLALPEPYRTAVVLRFYEELTIPQIAARLDAPAETVRTRLRRALAQLRDALDAGHGGDGRAWRLALVPLASGGPGAPPLSVPGGLLVTAKTKASLVAALLLAALAVSTALLVPWGGAATDAGDAGSASTTTPGVAPRRRSVAPADAGGGEVASLAAAPRGTASIVGRVRHGESGRPAVGQSVVADTPGAAPLTTTTDGRGAFRFDALADGRVWRIRVAAQGFATVTLPNLRLGRDESRDVGVLLLEAPRTLEVTVKDWGDRAVAGAEVEVHRQPPWRSMVSSDQWSQAESFRDVPEAVATVTAGADGRAVFHGLAGGEWIVVARAAGFVADALQRVSAQATAAGAERRSRVLVRLQRGERVEGRVVDRDGGGAPGWTVWAGHLDPFRGAGVTPRAVTDAAGRFAIDGVARGDVSLHLSRAGASPATVATVRVPAGGPVEIVLGGGVIEGCVTDARDGSPVAGAHVLVSMRDRHAVWIVAATSGEDGRYRAETLRDGDVSMFRVERAGFATHSHNPWAAGRCDFVGGRATFDVALRPGVPVAGRVEGPAGPVGDARVVAHWFSDPTGMARAEATTDADGRFALKGVPPATVVLQVFSDAGLQTGLAQDWLTELLWKRRPSGSIDVPEAGVEDVVLTLAPTRTVTGRVESADGAPLPDAAGATVQIEAVTATAAPDATFVVRAGTAPRPQTLHAWVPGQGRGSAEIPGEGDVADVVVRLMPQLRVSGRVTGPGGGAAPEGSSALVLCLLRQPVYGQKEAMVLRAPVVDGRFATSFTPYAPGEPRYVVRASAPGCASGDSAPFTVEPGRASFEADVALAALLALEGRVLAADDAGAPVAGARIAVLPADWAPDPNDRAARPLAATSDAEGRFRIPDVAAGPVRLQIERAGFVRDVFETRVPAGDFVVRLAPAREIAGVVTLADGTPLAGVSVSVLRLAGAQFEFASGTSDAAGAFRIPGLRAAPYKVSASQPWNGTASLRPWEREGVEGGTTDLRIVMEPASSIAGRVVDADGTPLAGCSVQAASETGDPYTPSDTTDAGGAFVIRGLGRGTYFLVARPQQGAEPRWLPARVGGLAPGATGVEIRLAEGRTIRGVLTDTASAPVAHAWVRAERLADGSEDPWVAPYGDLGARTGLDGAFRISGLAPGRYRLVEAVDPMNPARSRYRPLRGGEDVAAGADGVRLTTGGLGTISGIVVDEDGRPLADAGVSATPAGGGPRVGARSGADGSFTLSGVSDVVRWSVAATVRDRVPATADDVAVGATDVRLTIARGLEATGVVRNADGSPFASGYLRLTAERGAYSVVAQTDAEGRFTAKALRPGVYEAEEILTEIRPGGRTEPRRCGRVTAGTTDAALQFAE